MTAAFSWRLTRDLPLDEILSGIDGEVRKRKTVEAVLRVLDNSKWAIFNCLWKHFESAVVLKALTLKIQNLCLAKYDFLSRGSSVLSRPFGLVVDPSDGCTLVRPTCGHCCRKRELKLFICDHMTLPEARFTALLKCYGAYAMHTTFYHHGDAQLNPDTPTLIRLAKKYLLRTTLSTNLSSGCIDADAYVESGLDCIVVASDGATKAGLELIHRNIRALVEAKRRLGKPTPVIDVRPDVILEFARDNEDAMTGSLLPACLDASTIEREFEARWVSLAQTTRERRTRTERSTCTCHWLYKNTPRPGIDSMQSNFDGAQIRQYLNAAGRGLFDTASVDILSSRWAVSP